MNHVDRFIGSINKKSFDRIPMFYDASPEMNKVLEDYLDMKIDSITTNVFDVDRKLVWPSYIGPELKIHEDGSIENFFGVRTKEISYGQGSYMESVFNPMSHVTALDQISNYPWPKSEWIDTNGVIDQIKFQKEYAMMFSFYSIGWTSWEMRGMSTFLEDLLLEPELANEIIHAISDFVFSVYYSVINAHRQCPIDNFTCILLADDWATQDSLMISPEIFKNFFKNHYRRIIDIAHAANLKVEFHCCGSVIDLIPQLIDVGVDILNPIQTSAKGMNPIFLKKEFGKDLAFSGGVDVQTILPFGTEQSVADEVKFLLDVLGKDGGYIFGPSHSIQIGTPPQNIVAMYKAAHEYYGK